MDRLTRWAERDIVPKVSRITNMKYFQALRAGFFTIIPLTIIGSIFMLITDFPIPGYADFMAGVFGENWANFISPAARATFNMMGMMFAGTMSYKLAEQYDLDKLSALVLGLVAYVIVIPKTVKTDAGVVVEKVMSFDWTGTQGVITSIFTSIITVEIIRFCIKHNVIIKMPASVPDMVSKAFSALLPGFFIAVACLVLNGIGTVVSGSFPQMIYSAIQVPLQGLIATPFAIIIVAVLNGLLWWFGIHPTVVNSMVNPILYANAEKNQALAEMGKLSLHSGNYGTIQVIDQFATIGGAGCTIGLAIAIIIVARSSRMKAMAKVAGIPAIFNINEPLIFGVPVIFNPLLFIPVILAPIVSVLLAYFAIAVGFMPMFTGIQAPWTTPFIFSGFIVAGWQGAVVQILAVIASVLIYYPFVKALDHQYRGEEEAQEKQETAEVTV